MSLSFSVDHNQKLLAGVVNWVHTDHPTTLSEPILYLYQLNFHCKQLWLLFHLSCEFWTGFLPQEHRGYELETSGHDTSQNK